MPRTPAPTRSFPRGHTPRYVEDGGVSVAAAGAAGVEPVTPPADMPWGVREMHVRHPDGHVFRIGTGLEESGITE